MGQQASTPAQEAPLTLPLAVAMASQQPASAAPAEAESHPQQQQQPPPADPLGDSNSPSPLVLSRAGSASSNSSFQLVSGGRASGVRSASPSASCSSQPSDFSHVHDDDARSASPASSQRFLAVSPASVLPLSRWSSGSSTLDLASCPSPLTPASEYAPTNLLRSLPLSRETSGVAFSDHSSSDAEECKYLAVAPLSPRAAAFLETGVWTAEVESPASEPAVASFTAVNHLPSIEERDYDQEYADAMADAMADTEYDRQQFTDECADSSDVHLRPRHQSSLGVRVTHKSLRTRKLTRIENAVELRQYREEKAQRKTATATARPHSPHRAPTAADSYFFQAAEPEPNNNFRESAYNRQRAAVKSHTVTQHKATSDEHPHPVVYDKKNHSKRADQQLTAPDNLLFATPFDPAAFGAAARARYASVIRKHAAATGCVVQEMTPMALNYLHSLTDTDRDAKVTMREYTSCWSLSPYSSWNTIHFTNSSVAYVKSARYELSSLGQWLRHLAPGESMEIRLCLRLGVGEWEGTVWQILLKKKAAEEVPGAADCHQVARKQKVRRAKQHQRALVRAVRDVDWSNDDAAVDRLRIFSARNCNERERWTEYPRDLPYSKRPCDMSNGLYEFEQHGEAAEKDREAGLERLVREYTEAVAANQVAIAAAQKAEQESQPAVTSTTAAAWSYSPWLAEGEDQAWRDTDDELDWSVDDDVPVGRKHHRGAHGPQGKASRKEKKAMTLVFNQRRRDTQKELADPMNQPRMEGDVAVAAAHVDPNTPAGRHQSAAQRKKKVEKKPTFVGRKARGDLPRKSHTCSASSHADLPANGFVNRALKSSGARVDLKQVIQAMTERAVDVADGAAHLGVQRRRAAHPCAFRPSKRVYFTQRGFKWRCGEKRGAPLPFQFSRSEIPSFQRAFLALFRAPLERAFHSVPSGMRIRSIKPYEAHTPETETARPWLHTPSSSRFFTAVLRCLNDQRQGNPKTTEIDLRFNIPGSCAFAKTHTHDGGSHVAVRVTADQRRQLMRGRLSAHELRESLADNPHLHQHPHALHSATICQRMCQLNTETLNPRRQWAEADQPIQTYSLDNMHSLVARLPTSPQHITVDHAATASSSTSIRPLAHPTIVVSAVMNGDLSHGQPAFIPGSKRTNSNRYVWWRRRLGKFMPAYHTLTWVKQRREKRACTGKFSAVGAAYQRPPVPHAVLHRDDVLDSAMMMPALQIEYEVIADRYTVRPRELAGKKVQRELKRAIRLQEGRTRAATHQHAEKLHSKSRSAARESSLLSKFGLTPLIPHRQLDRHARLQACIDEDNRLVCQAEKEQREAELAELYAWREEKEWREHLYDLECQARAEKKREKKREAAQRRVARRRAAVQSARLPLAPPKGAPAVASHLPSVAPEPKCANTRTCERGDNGRRGKATRKERKALRMIYNQRKVAREEEEAAAAMAAGTVCVDATPPPADELTLIPQHLSSSSLKRESRLARRAEELRHQRSTRRRAEKAHSIAVSNHRATTLWQRRDLTPWQPTDEVTEDEGYPGWHIEYVLEGEQLWQDHLDYIHQKKLEAEQQRQRDSMEEKKEADEPAAAAPVHAVIAHDEPQAETDRRVAPHVERDRSMLGGGGLLVLADELANQLAASSSLSGAPASSSSPRLAPACEAAYATTEDDEAAPDSSADHHEFEQDWNSRYSGVEEQEEYDDDASYCFQDRADSLACGFDDAVGPLRGSPFVHTDRRLIRSAAEKELQSATRKAPSNDIVHHKHTSRRGAKGSKGTHRQEARVHRETR